LLFLPILLYWESFTSPWREIRGNVRVVVLLSTVLVAGTAALVAVTAHALGLPWGPAWVLGAALAPTDATAVGVLSGALPRRLTATLRAESLVNDGTALVIYGLAVALVITWLAVQVRRRLDDPAQHVLLAILAPLCAYLLAESIEASGVLA